MEKREIKKKRCTKCKKWKDKSKFNRNQTYKDRLNYICKQCYRTYRCSKFGVNGKTLKKYYTYKESHRVVNGVKEKRCRRCRTWKAESMFFRKRIHKDGLACWCKECSNKATNKARKQRTAGN